MQKDYLELVKKLDSKINDVEKLIQLLLINNLIDDVEDTIDISKKCIDERVNEEILKNGLEFEGFNKINMPYKKQSSFCVAEAAFVV